MLSREDTIKAFRGEIKIVNVPEWNGDVGIRKISASELFRLREMFAEKESKTQEDEFKTTCEILALTLCDENGVRLFEAKDLMEWDGQQMKIMLRLVDEAMSHNSIGKEAGDAIAKKSENDQTLEST